MKVKRKHTIATYICLVIYIMCIIVLIVEASMNGTVSANQSNAVGGTLANFFNDVKGDQTVAVVPTDLNIKNKITTGYVGDTYKLEVESLPKDTTYKSVIYKSSNDRVASINNEGVITFVNQGHATIEAINEKYTNIKDSFDIDVFTVEATGIESFINNATKDDNNVYTLYLSNEYTIQTAFTPENTTDKSLTYSCDTSYLEVTKEGNIIPKKYSADKVLDITVTHKELTSTIKVKIDHESVIKLENYTISLSNTNVYVKQTVTPTIKVTPSDTTFKDYTLSSSDTSIFKVSSNKSIVGVKAGSAKLIVKSNYYENIETSLDITVLPQPEFSDFTVSNITLFEGQQSKVSYKKNPTYSKDPTSIAYESNDPSIATVSSNGTVTGIKAGSTKIKVTLDGITKTCSVNVKSNDVTTDTDFELTPVNTTLNYGVEYNMSSIATVKWTPSKPANTSITYELEDSSVGTINGTKITLTEFGTHKVYATHTATGKTHSIDLTCTTFDFDIINLDNELVTSKSLIVNQTFMFDIIDTQNNTNYQTYNISIDNPEVISLSQINEFYEIKALDSGVATITITPYIDEETDGKSKEITISVSHIYSSSIDYRIINNSNNKEVILENNHLETYINSSYTVLPVLSNDSTISKVRYSSSNENVATVEANGNIIFNTIGKTTITVHDELSDTSASFELSIFNLIALNEDSPFTLEGHNAEKLGENSYSITNGHSGHVHLNFTEESTYKSVTYSSSNPNVASIGQDGTITPNKTGKTTITMTCDDGMHKKVEITFELTIERQDYIQDLSKFFYQVRKGLGHFSAFLILGIFSTITWLLFLNGKKLFLSIPLNYASGFAIAAITEIIQLYVPGRGGQYKDVLLDFDGFKVSATIITIIIVICTIIRARRNSLRNR